MSPWMLRTVLRQADKELREDQERWTPVPAKPSSSFNTSAWWRLTLYCRVARDLSGQRAPTFARVSERLLLGERINSVNGLKEQRDLFIAAISIDRPGGVDARS